MFYILEVSYNRPHIYLNASWNPCAETLPTKDVTLSSPNDVFVDINNVVYTIDRAETSIIMWLREDERPTKIKCSDLSESQSIFVSLNGDIYVDNGKHGKRVEKWIVKMNTSIPVMTVDNACYGLFIDINNSIYCSIGNSHKVVKQSLDSSNGEGSKTVAGTGNPGSEGNTLYSPHGIFVDLNYDLYVADCHNNRIQLFHSGEKNGITVVGEKATNPFSLQCPTGIILDADRNLFIVDKKHRIVRSGPGGFRCIAACSNTAGLGSNQLSQPRGLSFDSHGNIYVSDHDNDRIQKFLLSTNSCSKCF